jgi:hypothetical protein
VAGGAFDRPPGRNRLAYHAVDAGGLVVLIGRHQIQLPSRFQNTSQGRREQVGGCVITTNSDMGILQHPCSDFQNSDSNKPKVPFILDCKNEKVASCVAVRRRWNPLHPPRPPFPIVVKASFTKSAITHHAIVVPFKFRLANRLPPGQERPLATVDQSPHRTGDQLAGRRRLTADPRDHHPGNDRHTEPDSHRRQPPKCP